jgi:hypothetical protein
VTEPLKQRWQKLGRVYRANGELPWQTSHAYIPTACLLSEDTIRVFVAFLDARHVGRIGYVDVDAADPMRVKAVAQHPALDIGRPGTFDEHGVSPLCITRSGPLLYLFYVGWQLSPSVRYFLFTGLARSENHGETFTRVSESPILDRRDGELLVRSGGFVFSHGGQWIQTYMAGSNQVDVGGKLTPTYDMMSLTSDTATLWAGPGTLRLSPNRPAEFGFGRPWVLVENGLCRMWLSVRSADTGYGLTYAESADGLAWTRYDDTIEFVGEQQHWDSDTKSFASIVDTQAGRFMFYNGNGFGETGFGVAQLLDEERG